MADTPSPQTPPIKKAVVKPAVKPVVKTTAAPAPASAPPSPPPSPPTFFKKAWKKLDDWNVGISGKAIIILMIVGLLSEIYHKL